MDKKEDSREHPGVAIDIALDDEVIVEDVENEPKRLNNNPREHDLRT